MKKVTKKNESEFDFKTIKSFEDACKRENVDPSKLPDVSMIPEEFKKAILACYRLFIIFKAINNKWVANWSNCNQYKYFPWFEVLASGSGFSRSGSVYGCTGTCVGSRLCTDTSEKAQYIAKQFKSEYSDFMLNSK